jgi:type I restriction-modification system DNA methylase subunit
LIPNEVLSLAAVKKHEEYYHLVLEPLFFEVMNKPVKDRKFGVIPQANIIPFLNGGLFEPHINDFYPGKANFGLKISNYWFIKFVEILEQYNFTIDENSTVDADVSLDPEMLGRIFENLHAEDEPETGETARKPTGTYYTPRVIVDYMVEQALNQYLLTRTTIPDEKVNSLLSYEDEPVNLTTDEKNSVVKALKEIKVIDPACGSGAFPMGVLHRMLLVLEKVDPDLEIWKRLYLSTYHPVMRKIIEDKLRKGNEQYIRKLTIIQDSIYGVDIQPIAVEIAKLRCFLSLVVDELVLDNEENRGIEPLPNLEFKFVAANTLIALPSAASQSAFGVTEMVDKLKKLREAYLRSFGTEKLEIEKEFKATQQKLFKENVQWAVANTLVKQLTEWDPFSYQSCGWFDPGWMFGVSGGFDIVIANPPWGIHLDVIESANVRAVSGVKKALDSSEAFIFVASNFLVNNGVLSYIVPKSIIFANDWRFSRNYILKNAIVCLGDCGISFEAVNLESAVVAFKKKTYSDNTNNVAIVRFEPIKRFSSDKTLVKVPAIDQRMMVKSEILALSEISNISANVLLTIQKQAFLEDYPREVFRGIYIPDNVKADISGSGKYLFVNKVPDVSMYSINRIIRIDLSEHLDRYEDIVRKLSRDRIIVKVMRGNRLTCAFAPKNVLTTEKLVNLIVKDNNLSQYYVLAFLNSKLCSFYLNKVVFSDITETSRVMDDCYLRKCPIFNLSPERQQPFIDLVSQILGITKDANYLSNITMQTKVRELENQIDQMVYELYGLTEEEIEVVNETFKK